MKSNRRRTIKRSCYAPQPSLSAMEYLESRRLLAAGGLDPTFGVGGKAVTPLASFGYYPIGQAVLQPSGKILVLETSVSDDPRVVRFTADGAPDSTFGVGGVLSFSSGVSAMAVRADGKLLIASAYQDVLLARFTVDGKIDTTFGGGDGEVSQPLFGGAKTNDHYVAKILIRPDNRIILAGSAGSASDAQVFNFAVAGFTESGDIDTSFGATYPGSTITDFGYDDTVNNAAFTPDGGIVAVGSVYKAGGKYPNRGEDFAVARYDDAGRLDPSFGGGVGWVITGFAPVPQARPKGPDGRDSASSVVVDATGKITVAGRSDDPAGFPSLGIVLYLSGGKLDSTFSPSGAEGSGKLRLPAAAGWYPIALAGAGKIFAINNGFGVIRLNGDGSFDETFGSGGKVETNFEQSAYAKELLVRTDGKIILVGKSGQSPFDTGNVALARYLTDSAETPFSGKPIDLALAEPIQLEDFNNGGEGVAFHDTDTANLGGAYRNTAVDIQAIPAGGNALAFARAGEWTEYTVTANSNAYCNATLTYASLKGGGKFHLEIDGTPVTVPITLSSTGGWQTYKTISLPSFEVATGQHLLRLALDANDATGFVGNFGVLNISQQLENMPIPYNPNHTPWLPNQTIQAEDFNTAGEGFGYHDTDRANVGGAYRLGEGVDIEPATDTGGGFNVGYVKAGEFLLYTISTAQAGLFGLAVRLASLRAGGRFHIDIDGVNVASFTVPATGGWQTYTTLSKPKSISLTAGLHSLKRVMDQNNSIGYVANFNWLKLTQ